MPLTFRPSLAHKSVFAVFANGSSSFVSLLAFASVFLSSGTGREKRGEVCAKARKDAHFSGRFEGTGRRDGGSVRESREWCTLLRQFGRKRRKSGEKCAAKQGMVHTSPEDSTEPDEETGGSVRKSREWCTLLRQFGRNRRESGEKCAAKQGMVHTSPEDSKEPDEETGEVCTKAEKDAHFSGNSGEIRGKSGGSVRKSREWCTLLRRFGRNRTQVGHGFDIRPCP